MTALLIITMLAYTVAAIAHNSYRIRKTVKSGQVDEYSKDWHFWQGIQFTIFFEAIAIIDWRAAFVGCIAFWIVYDLSLNYIHFNSLLYVGESSAIDKAFRKTKRPEVYMLIVKIVILIAGITVCILV